jgi:hypothetical protein
LDADHPVTGVLIPCRFTLNPQREDQPDAATSRRLDRLTRDVGVINRHQQIVIESLGLFIRHYLITSLPLPPSEQQAAQALGHQRFQRFIEQLGRRLASTTTFANEITDHLANQAPKSNASIPDAAKPPTTVSVLKT